MTSNLRIIHSLNEKDITRFIEIWKSSVLATHDFLSKKDFLELEVQLTNYLPKLKDFLVYEDSKGIRGFLKVNDRNIDMLFIEDEARGKGIGRKLIEYSIENLDVVTLDVNEDNGQALGFYEYMGFEVISRSETDDQGRAYPILHMRYRGKNK